MRFQLDGTISISAYVKSRSKYTWQIRIRVQYKCYENDSSIYGKHGDCAEFQTSGIHLWVISPQHQLKQMRFFNLLTSQLGHYMINEPPPPLEPYIKHWRSQNLQWPKTVSEWVIVTVYRHCKLFLSLICLWRPAITPALPKHRENLRKAAYVSAVTVAYA